MDRIGEFHTFEELSYALLLESNPQVTWFDSQPFTIQVIDGRRETPHAPDFFVKKEDGEMVVVEVQPAAEIPLANIPKYDALRAYCAKEAYSLIAVANEDLNARRTEVLNWLRITRWLIAYQKSDLTALASRISEVIRTTGPLSIAEILRHFSAVAPELTWVALSILFHRREATTDFVNAPLTTNSKVASL